MDKHFRSCSTGLQDAHFRHWQLDHPRLQIESKLTLSACNEPTYKSFAALILSQEIGKVFPAIVTGKSESGTWIRLKDLPVEGKLVSGFEKYDVGDPINAQLKHVDIEKGYIDFEKMRKK